MPSLQVKWWVDDTDKYYDNDVDVYYCMTNKD